MTCLLGAVVRDYNEGTCTANFGGRHIYNLMSSQPTVRQVIRVSIALVMLTQFFEAYADGAKTCSSNISFLNDNARFEAFDMREGGRDRRLQFLLQGREPCSENDCKVSIIRTMSGIGKAVASIDLTRRNASFCVHEPVKVNVPPTAVEDPKDEPTHSESSARDDTTLPPLNKDCPSSFLLNTLSIELEDELGPFSKQQINVEYVYRAVGRSVSLDECRYPYFIDGYFRAGDWRVQLDDGAAVKIFEMDFPKSKKMTVAALKAWQDVPFVVTVFGAKNK